MRKLTRIEETALFVLNDEGSVLVSLDDLSPVPEYMMRRVFDGLVKKKRASVEMTEAGPRFWPLSDA